MTNSVQFFGAAQTVTGSKHVVRTSQGNILLDCGLFQGRRAESRRINRQFDFKPAEIGAVILSHAHIDHSGLLPLLVKQGYQGPIYLTPATRDLCAIMLEDAANIQRSDAEFFNRQLMQGKVKGEPIEPLYSEQDVVETLKHMISVDYEQRFRMGPDAEFTFFDAGHVLGSAIVVLDLKDNGHTRRLAFSGDLGRGEAPILRDPQVPHGVEFLIMESTYGDRLHPEFAVMEDELLKVVERTLERKGKVIIPSFALERTQEIVYALNDLYNHRRLPQIPIYVDSPLAVSLTDIFRLHPECYSEEMRALLQRDSTPFDFPGLKYVSSVEESKALSASREPSVIISASGMCEAGRVLHHLRSTIESERNTVLIVGFQAQHTLGRRLVEKRDEVRIFGLFYPRRAEVVVLNGFSAHADQKGLLAFARSIKAQGRLRKVALVHGEPAAQNVLREKLLAEGFSDVSVPALQDSWSL